MGLATSCRWVSDIQQLLNLRALAFLIWLLGSSGYFHFKMYGIMTDIFLLAALFLLAFVICGFNLCHLCF